MLFFSLLKLRAVNSSFLKKAIILNVGIILAPQIYQKNNLLPQISIIITTFS